MRNRNGLDGGTPDDRDRRRAVFLLAVLLAANALFVCAITLHGESRWATELSIAVWGLNGMFLSVDFFRSRGEEDAGRFMFLLLLPLTLWAAACALKDLFLP